MTFTIDIADVEIERLKKLASRPTCVEKAEKRGEDFIPEDWAGGNFDDAYQLGCDDGDIEGARTLLDFCGITWKRD